MSTASFCMSGSISALLMMTFFGVGGAGEAAEAGCGGRTSGFRSSEWGFAIRVAAAPPPPTLFFASSSFISLLWVPVFVCEEGIYDMICVI